MNSINNKDLFINKSELRRSNSIVSDILQKNTTITGRIIEKLETINSNIKINYQTMNNKSTEIDYNMQVFKANCEGAMNSFEATITMYENAHKQGAEYIERKMGDYNG